MRAITTIFLDNTLSAILDTIDETSDLRSDLPGLIEFKEIVLHRIQQLRNHDRPALSGEEACTV